MFLDLKTLFFLKVNTFFKIIFISLYELFLDQFFLYKSYMIKLCCMFILKCFGKLFIRNMNLKLIIIMFISINHKLNCMELTTLSIYEFLEYQ